MIAPNFARTCSDRDVSEGKMTRFDCRVTGRPYPEVTWYINGRQVVDDASHKILVNESGSHALMITNVSRADSGIVTCVARNKAGETSFEVSLLTNPWTCWLFVLCLSFLAQMCLSCSISVQTKCDWKRASRSAQIRAKVWRCQYQRRRASQPYGTGCRNTNSKHLLAKGRWMWTIEPKGILSHSYQRQLRSMLLHYGLSDRAESVSYVVLADEFW